jgi:teichuronic acid exporter
MNIERQALSGLKWTAFAKLSSQVVSWASTLLVMRLLVPDDYGLMAVVTVVLSVLSNVAELGIGASVVQSRELTREDMAKISGLVILVSVGVFAALCLAAPLIGDAYDMPRLTALLWAAGTQILIASVATLPQALAQREFQFKRLAAVELAWALSTALSTFALAWYGAGVWSLVLGSLIGAVVRTALLVAGGGVVWPSFRLAGVRKFLAVGGAVMFGRLSWQVVYQSDVLIGARRLGSTDIGAYSVALQLATLPMQRIMGVINQVVLPTVARLQDERDRLRRRLLEGCRILTAFSVPVLWGMSATSPEIVGVALGPKWSTAVLPLQIISLVVPMRMVSAAFSTANLGIGRAGLDFRNNVVMAIVLPVCFFVGTYWGVNGLAASWLIATPTVLAFNFPRVAKALSTSVSDVVRAVWRPFAAGLAMYLAVVGCRYVLGALSDLMRMPLLVGAGAIVYVGSLHLLDRKMISDMTRIARAGGA